MRYTVEVRNYQRLFKAVDREPFRPFTVVLDSGRRVFVPDPDHVVFVPSRAKIWYVGVVDDEQDTLVEFEDIAVSAIEIARPDGKNRRSKGSA